MARRNRTARRAENAFPIGLLGVGLALVAFLLPSALRPPAPQTPATAELSPDAPPNDKTDSLIAALHRSSSGIAGTGDLGAGDGLGLAPPVTTPDTRKCRGGFGNPPRQTESAYSPPCSVDDRKAVGGTWRNVSAEEVRVGFWHILGMPAERGLVPTECTPQMSAQLRTFCYLQKYWNTRYNFFGRFIHLDAAADDPADDPGARTAAHNQAQNGDFAVVHLSDSFCDEFANHLHLVCFDGTATHDYVQENAAPYWWTYQQNHEQNEAFYGEYACKKLIGGNADFAGTGTKGKPRKLGIVVQSVAVTGFRTAKGIADQIKKQCGFVVPADAQVNIRDDDNNQSESTAVLKMINAGVTTVLMWSDTVPWNVVMSNAQAAGYFPEWVAINSNGLDFNTSGSTEPPLEMAHLFGMSGWEMPRPFSSTDCYKAYKAMDPANAPDATSCALIYVSLEHVMNGIQLAGPSLTPKTFEQGLFKYGHPQPRNPWEIGGGFGPGDRAFVDTLAEIWWDPSATDPTTGNPTGAYRYADDGQRYGLGDMKRELHVFHPGDPTQAKG
jgi:hypothetical protein